MADSMEIGVENISFAKKKSVDSGHAVELLTNLFEDYKSRDVTLVAGKDRQKFPVHRLIMKKSSEFFVALFGQNFKEGEQDEVTISDIDGVTLKAIIDFCYLGTIEITDANIAEIIAAAEYLQLLRLKQKCEKNCVDNLTKSNCVEMVSLADIYNLEDLRAECMRILYSEFAYVTGFEELDHSIFCAVLNYNYHSIREDILFERFVQWIDHDKDERSKFAATLFQSIVLHKITLPTLLNAVKKFALKHDCESAVVNECYRRLKRDDSRTVNTLRLDDSRRPQTICVSSRKENIISIHQYNPITNRWNLFAHGNAENKMEKRPTTTVATPNKLVFLGGTQMMVIKVNVYDLDTQELSDSSSILYGGRNIHPVYLNGQIFLFGGIENQIVLNDCGSFSLDLMESQILAPMLQRRYKYAAAVMKGKIYVAGGKVNHNTHLTSVECYEPARNEWVQLANMNHSRSMFALVECDGMLYAMGHHRSVERYDSLKNTWTVIGSFDGGQKISRAIILGGQIYALMGDGRFGILKTAPEFSWYRLRDVDAPSEGRRLLFIR